ncbi:MAG: LysE family translocator [bacterium]|nr:LysE family translocator [bacterium]
MTIALLTALITFAFVTLITPGPNNIMLLASGINYGYRRTFPHLAGIGIGFAVMLVLVGIGIMQLVELFPSAVMILKIVCTLYLLYLAAKIASAAPPGANADHSKHAGKPLTLLQAALFQWVNPKAWTMQLTAVSVYTPSDPVFIDFLMVAGVFGIMVIPINSLWILAGRQLRPLFNNQRRMQAFNAACALLLVASLYPIFIGTH